jgi:hypothetical protein
MELSKILASAARSAQLRGSCAPRFPHSSVVGDRYTYVLAADPLRGRPYDALVVYVWDGLTWDWSDGDTRVARALQAQASPPVPRAARKHQRNRPFTAVSMQKGVSTPDGVNGGLAERGFVAGGCQAFADEPAQAGLLAQQAGREGRPQAVLLEGEWVAEGPSEALHVQTLRARQKEMDPRAVANSTCFCK